MNIALPDDDYTTILSEKGASTYILKCNNKSCISNSFSSTVLAVLEPASMGKKVKINYCQSEGSNLIHEFS